MRFYKVLKDNLSKYFMKEVNVIKRGGGEEMTKLDIYWMSNEEWIREADDGFGYILKEDAPEEAQESYKRFLEQVEKATERGAM